MSDAPNQRCVCGHWLEQHAADTTTVSVDRPCMFRFIDGTGRVLDCPCDQYATKEPNAAERRKIREMNGPSGGEMSGRAKEF